MYYSKLWEYKNYLYLLLGNTLFNLGFMLYQVVFFWLAYDMTKLPVTAGYFYLKMYLDKLGILKTMAQDCRQLY